MVGSLQINGVSLDCSMLSQPQPDRVRAAIEEGECLYGYIPESALDFVRSNFKQLAQLKILEATWMLAYMHSSHFADTPLSVLQAVFDACDKDILQRQYPIPIPAEARFSAGRRFSLFRGCAGPEHRMGMSWLASLDKAIWYAAKHAAHYELTNLAVYAAVVDRSEIYCCGDHYDHDYIVYPKAWWRVDVPATEFRLDRPR